MINNCQASRDFYVKNFGFEVEFEDLSHRIVAIKDDADFTIFLAEPQGTLAGFKCSLTLQVDDVDSKYRTLGARGAKFQSPLAKHF